MNENEYVIAYTYKGQRRFEHIFARTPGEAQDLFKGRHSEHIDSCVLAKYSTHKRQLSLLYLLEVWYYSL